MQCNETWIDSHCHLDAAEFEPDRDEVVAQSRAAGVSRWVVPAVSAATFASTVAMRTRYGAEIALGLHPVYVAEHDDAHLDELASWVAQHQPVAIGEIGLDFYMPGLDRQRQIDVFERQLRLARDVDLPVIVHIRRSQDEVLKYLKKWQVKGGIAHAFNGSEQQAARFIDLGFKLGFGGAATYSGSQRIRRLVAGLPLEAIVLETDSPDMAPSWLAGSPPGRNTPAELPRIAAEVALLRGITLDALARATRANTAAALSQMWP
ncbi:TatD family hydrolase [Chitinibacteraceae bacterium HSL-7]